MVGLLSGPDVVGVTSAEDDVGTDGGGAVDLETVVFLLDGLDGDRVDAVGGQGGEGGEEGDGRDHGARTRGGCVGWMDYTEVVDEKRKGRKESRDGSDHAVSIARVVDGKEKEDDVSRLWMSSLLVCRFE